MVNAMPSLLASLKIITSHPGGDLPISTSVCLHSAFGLIIGELGTKAAQEKILLSGRKLN
jgi:hypothetical protein